VYEQLPFNTMYFFDLILRNALLQVNDCMPSITVDIGINIDEELDSSTGSLTLVGKVMDIGDLSTYASFEEVDLRGSSVGGVITQIDQRLSIDQIRSLSNKK
jgi:hypothetical protein